MMDLETPLLMTQQESVDMVASAARDFAENMYAHTLWNGMKSNTSPWM